MLSNFHIFLLSVLQGITEFLPVSSSGHLILFSKFTTFPDQGLALDVAVHVGSILAVMIYFSEELWKMFKGLLKTYFIPTMKNADARTFWLIVIGTIPIVIVGLLLKENGMEWLRSTKIIGWTILGYGLLLFVADKFGMTIRKINHLSPLDAFLIGCAPMPGPYSGNQSFRSHDYYGTILKYGTSRSGKIFDVIIDSRHYCSCFPGCFRTLSTGKFGCCRRDD